MKAIENFEEWCINNNHRNILERWDYRKNPDKPSDLGRGSNQKRYFICPECGRSWPHMINNIVGKGYLPPCKYCNSFGVWCQKHARLDLLKRWDYELNQCSPFEVQRSSTVRLYYFKCPRGLHESEPKRLDKITSYYNASRCNGCNSFGQWGKDNICENFLEKYWSDKNTKDPMKLAKCANVKVWIKCPNKAYHKDYQVTCNNFYRGSRCPYCAGVLLDIHDSVGYIYPESQKFWFQKNITPFDVLPSSDKLVYWKCKIHGGLYKQRVHDAIRSGYTCPKCSRAKTESSYEEKVRTYLEDLFGTDDIRHEKECTISPINPHTNNKLRYDNEIVSLKLIIQVNGKQHYDPKNGYVSQKRSRCQQFDYRKRLDDFKKKYALEHGYNYLVIPYWEFDDKETWKQSIDNKIKSIDGDVYKKVFHSA